jgi:hypothetical protein
MASTREQRTTKQPTMHRIIGAALLRRTGGAHGSIFLSEALLLSAGLRLGAQEFLPFDNANCRFALSMSQQFAKDATMDGVRGREANLPFGILAGAIAAIIGALIWMGITVATGLHVGYVALGVGALVGLTVRFVGNGRSAIFGIIGAVLTLIGCLGGEVLTVVQLASTPQRDFLNTLTTIDLTQLATNIFDKMDPIMYLIYAIGIFEGYKLSIRK